MLFVGSLANGNDMPLSLSQPNTYQSNWDLSAKYQQDEIIFQDMVKDGGTKNKYNVDGYEMRQPDADAGENYASGKYYEKESTYLLENVNGKFSNGNVTRFFCLDCFLYSAASMKFNQMIFLFRRISSRFVAP